MLLAANIAASASLSSWCGSRASGWATATPTLADSGTEMPEAGKGRVKVPCRRKARSAASETWHPRASTTNWSLPSRPTASPGRSAPASRCPTWRSSWSPMPWPSESLMVLKPSRSSTIRAAPAPSSAGPSASASAVRSSSVPRLASPVRSSCRARQASACSPRTRSVMSVWVTTIRRDCSTREACSRNQPVVVGVDRGYSCSKLAGAGSAGASSSRPMPAAIVSASAGASPGRIAAR